MFNKNLKNINESRKNQFFKNFQMNKKVIKLNEMKIP